MEALIGDDPIVLKSTCQMKLIRFVSSALGQVTSHTGVVQNSLRLLRMCHGLNEGKTFELLVLKKSNSLVGTCIDVRGFSPHEAWRENHLVPYDHAVKSQMMPHQLPAPRVDRRGFTKEREIKAPLSKHLCISSELAKKVIDLHHISGFFKTCFTQAGRNDLQYQGFECLAHLF